MNLMMSGMNEFADLFGTGISGVVVVGLCEKV